jgi:structural maintenance of chromosome 4
MSGGEKTLSSLCLLLSFQDLFSFKWYLLDEIDAALDFKNVTKLSFQFKYQIKNSQIFLITLRNNLILNINYIFGIYKFKKASNTICLRI